MLTQDLERRVSEIPSLKEDAKIISAKDKLYTYRRPETHSDQEDDSLFRSQQRISWRKRVEDWLESPRVVTGICVSLFVLAVVLALETSETIMRDLGPLLSWIDNIIVVIFVVELSLRMFALRLYFFGDPWNWFDLIVVGFSVFPLVVSILSLEGSVVNISALRIIRVFRLLRIIRSSKHLKLLVNSLLLSLPNLGWICLLLLVFYYVFALIGTLAFGPTFPDWFGTLPRSMYTLFQVMTLESWSMGISRPVMAVHSWAWLYFVPFILVATYTTLNIFVAIIVNTMQQLQQERIKDEVTHQIDDFLHEEERMFQSSSGFEQSDGEDKRDYSYNSDGSYHNTPQQQRRHFHGSFHLLPQQHVCYLGEEESNRLKDLAKDVDYIKSQLSRLDKFLSRKGRRKKKANSLPRNTNFFNEV